MSQLYFILSVAGWAWLVVVGTFFAVRFVIWFFTMRKSDRHGFDVVGPGTAGVPPRGESVGDAR